MPVSNGTESVSDDESLYRRIPVSQGWYDPEIAPHPSPLAFRPNRNDVTGLSVFRAKYKSIEEAARGREGKSYYVAVLRVGDLRAHGIEILAEGEPGHAELPGLTYQERKTEKVIELADLLATQLCMRVEGPFPR